MLFQDEIGYVGNLSFDLYAFALNCALYLFEGHKPNMC